MQLSDPFYTKKVFLWQQQRLPTEYKWLISIYVRIILHQIYTHIQETFDFLCTASIKSLVIA